MKNKDVLLLETKNIVKNYIGLCAVDNINFRVNSGDCFCMIGPNGAGKSTFFKLLMGIEKVDSGEIYFENKRITNTPLFIRARNRMGMKFQKNNIFEELTVEDNLKTAAAIATNAKHEQNLHYEPLDLFTKFTELNKISKSIAKNITYCQKQWLEISMVLCSYPILLLLDEPSAGMTTEETFETAKVLKEISKLGISIIVVEHDMKFVQEVNWQTFILHQGRILFNGSVSEVQKNKEVQEIYLGKTS